MGLPAAPQKVGSELLIPGPVGRARDVAERYMRGRDYGIPPPDRSYPLDKELSARIAGAYDELPMFDPAALPSYRQMARETMNQYKAIKESGLKIIPTNAETYPYKGNPREVAVDVADRNRMAFFLTEPEAGAFGSGGAANIARSHPLLEQSGEYIGKTPLTNNDLFRVVHDYFGHIQHGHGFRGLGEDNAWRSHSAMYSPEARPAMTSETRGQNSWVNYGPHGEFNRTASGGDTIYAPQKIGILPDWAMKYGIGGVVPTAAAIGALADQSRLPEEVR
jgi:hypothetical protein